MAKVRVVVDEKAVRRFVSETPEVKAALMGVAEQYKETASQATPKGRSTGQFRWLPHGGLVGPFGKPYRHGFAKVSYHVRPFRSGLRVYTRDRFAHLIEYGSLFNPVYAPMRRALFAFKRGGRVVVNPSKSSGEHTA